LLFTWLRVEKIGLHGVP